MPREWLTIKDGAIKGDHTKKRVERSDFKRIREMGPNQEGGGSTSISYELAGMWFGETIFEGETYETLEIPGAGNIEIEGAPELPQEGLFVAIPENADVTELVFEITTEQTFPRPKFVRPVSKPVRGRERPRYIPDKRIYQNDNPYPGGRPCRLIGTKRVAGRKVAHIMLYPVQYRPSSRTLVVLKSIRLEVRYRKEKTDGPDPVAPRRIFQTAPTDRLILDSANQLEAERERLMREPSSRNCSSLKDCNNEGEYLIITTNNFKKSVEHFVTEKPRDYTVKVVTKEDILREFLYDTAESELQPEPEPDPKVVADVILEFLQHASDNWEKGPLWVVLAGDTNDIPTHFYNVEGKDEGSIPEQFASDHFYADLKDDVAPDLMVSRWGTSDVNVMENIWRKSAEAPDPSWANRILFVTQNVPDDPDVAACTEQVTAMVGNRYPLMPPALSGLLSGNRILQAPVIDAINGGVGLINYVGHGEKTEWSDGLNCDEVHQQLTNQDTPPIVLSIACYTNCVDFDDAFGNCFGKCFGELWISENKAIAFLGASWGAWKTQNYLFDKFLFEAHFVAGKTLIGDIMNYAKGKLYQQSTVSDPVEETWNNVEEDKGSNQVKDNIRMYLLLGDPCATFGGIHE